VSATPQFEVAQFSDPNQGDTASQFGASITWGDRGSSSGTISAAVGLYTVKAAVTEETETAGLLLGVSRCNGLFIDREERAKIKMIRR
jgi:hypothetical protein